MFTFDGCGLPSSDALMDGFQRFGETYHFHHQDGMTWRNMTHCTTYQMIEFHIFSAVET